MPTRVSPINTHSQADGGECVHSASTAPIKITQFGGVGSEGARRGQVEQGNGKAIILITNRHQRDVIERQNRERRK